MRPYPAPVAISATDELPFTEDDLAPAVGAIVGLHEAATGWINFLPEVEPGHEVPPRNLAVVLFSARGEAVPLATWSAPEVTGGRATLGIQHGSGPKALARLAEMDLALPAGWIKVSDHPRRGLVVTTPGNADPDDVLWWLLTSSHALSTVPLTGDWLARVYRD